LCDRHGTVPINYTGRQVVVADYGGVTVSGVPGRPSQRRSANPPGLRVPVAPRVPAEMDRAAATEHGLEHEVAFRRLCFEDIDLSGGDADLVEFDQCRFRRAVLAAATLDQLRFVDCLVENCDWANVRMVRPTMIRLHLAAVRLTGAECVAGALRDVVFHQCRIDLAAFRFTSFKDVTFDGCNLTSSDFTGADLRGATFTRCDLSGAQFSNANCDGARFAGCELAGIGGVTSLKGATLAGHDLVALSHAFARALGITIDDS